MEAESRRTITIFIPEKDRADFYNSLSVLRSHYKPHTTSALIAALILSVAPKRAESIQEEVSSEKRPANIAISVSGNQYDELRTRLERLKPLYTRSSISSIIVKLVIEAAKKLDHNLEDGGSTKNKGTGFAPVPGNLPRSVLDRVALQGLNCPSVFWSAHYRGLKDVADQLYDVLLVFANRLEQDRANSLAQLAQVYQELATVHRDRGDLENAADLLTRAVHAAEDLENQQPAESINSLAAALYRRAHVFAKLVSHQHDEKEREAYQSKAQEDIERAGWLVPQCRPILGAAIALRIADMRAHYGTHHDMVFPWLDYALQFKFLHQAYDESGVMINASSTLHVRARIILECRQNPAVSLDNGYTLNDALNNISQALLALPDEFERWRLDIEVTKLRILVALKRFDEATVLATDLQGRMHTTNSYAIQENYRNAVNQLAQRHGEQAEKIGMLVKSALGAPDS